MTVPTAIAENTEPAAPRVVIIPAKPMSSQGAPITIKKAASQHQPSHHHHQHQQQQQHPLTKQGSQTENNPFLDEEPAAQKQPKDSHVSEHIVQAKSLPKQSSNKEELVKAIYDYDAQGPQELSFKTGDLLT